MGRYIWFCDQMIICACYDNRLNELSTFFKMRAAKVPINANKAKKNTFLIKLVLTNFRIFQNSPTCANQGTLLVPYFDCKTF